MTRWCRAAARWALCGVLMAVAGCAARAGVPHAAGSAPPTDARPSASEGDEELTAIEARQARLDRPQAPAIPPPPAGSPVTCDAQSSPVTCAAAVDVVAPDVTAWLRPLNSVELSADALTVIGPDPADWIAFARNSAGPAVGIERVYVDGMPAAGALTAASISRVSVNSDPFSSEYAGAGEIRVNVDLRPPDRRWRLGGSLPSAGGGGGSPLGPSGTPVSRSSGLSVSGPLPRLPLTFAVHATHRFARRGVLFVDPASSALEPADGDRRPTSRGVGLTAGLSFAAAGAIVRTTFIGSSNEARHAGIGGTRGPTTGLRLESASRALQATWRIGAGARVHRGGWSVTHQRLDAAAESLDAAVRIVGQLTTGGNPLAGEARRASALSVKHVVEGGSGRWKLGAEGHHDTVSNTRVPNAFGRLHASTLDAATGTWIVTRGTSTASATATSAALFAERAAVDTPRLSARWGVRADWQNGDGTYVSPRVLVAARVAGFQVSGGAGTFVQRWFPDLLIAAAHSAAAGSITYVAPDIPIGSVEERDPAMGVAMRTVMGANFERRRDLIVRGGLHRRVGAVQAGVEHTWTRGQSLAGTTRERHALGLLDTVESNRRLRLHQTHASATFRLGAGSVAAYYQHARAFDDGGGLLAAPVRRGDVAAEWGRSSGVPRHAAGVTAMLPLPWHVRMSVSAQGHAGIPFTVITGRDAGDLATFSDRAGRARNDGVLPPSFRASVFLARTVRIPGLNGLAFDVGIRADNLTDHRNVTSVGPVAGTGMFGRPLDASPGRSVQFWATLAR